MARLIGKQACIINGVSSVADYTFASGQPPTCSKLRLAASSNKTSLGVVYYEMNERLQISPH
jgi:hypothetical protein